MDNINGPVKYYKKPVDCRTSAEKQHDKIRDRSRNYYYMLLNILTDMNIPYEVEETNEDTIIRWDGHEKVLQYWIDPFHKWKK